MVRHNNQLPNNLPQLQNLIKRDPSSYKDEFNQQFQHFLSTLEIFKFTPNEENKSFYELTMFIAQVSQCYPDECIQFPQHLVDLLKNHASTLHPSMRNCFCKALILMRNKNLIPALDLLELFFQLLRCNDKQLRTFLEEHIISDIKNMNAKHKDMKLNSTLQNFISTMLKDSNPKAAKMSVNIMIELYKKGIWNDAKPVNVIATVGCFSKITKVNLNFHTKGALSKLVSPQVMVASLKFFLGQDEDEKGSDESDSEEDIDVKGAIMANRVSKKTKKRQKQLDKIKKQAVKQSKKKSKAEHFNFSGIHLIHNPQGMAESLFKQLQTTNERFEVKLMHLDVISRLIGIHDLFLFSFYPYITRFLQPHQRQVTRILMFAAQASHELVPGDVIEPVLKTIANNFITERNSSDVMAIGLNAAREICARCPLAMGEDLLRDLAMYKTYKEKSVMMAARSLIMLYREQLPALLHKKDRGRPTEAQADRKVKNYGEIISHDTVPGAEVLLKDAKSVDVDDDEDGSSSEDEGWVDIPDSGGEDEDENDEDVDDEDEEEDGSDEEDEDDEDESGEENSGDDEDVEETKEDNSEKEEEDSKKTDTTKILDEKQAAQELALTKIFTDEDFKRIDAANVKKSVTASRKRPLESEKSEFVKLNNIEMIFKKRRHDKQSRLETVEAGRIDRQKFGYKDGRQNEHCSKTNREKTKRKNFVMMRHKARSKGKKSFKEKQLAMRNYLLKQKKMK